MVSRIVWFCYLLNMEGFDLDYLSISTVRKWLNLMLDYKLFSNRLLSSFVDRQQSELDSYLDIYLP